METLYKVLLLVACAIVGYLTGSISSGIIISKIKYQKDPRDYGSHNSGGTNVGRTFGLKTGLLTIFFDILKTMIPIWICYFTFKYTDLNVFNLEQYSFLACAVASLIGHCFPIYHNFRGGKAVSSFAGVILATSWFLGIIGIIMFLVLLLATKKVSVCSIFTSFTIACLSFVLLVCPQFFMDFSMIPSIYYSITLIVCSLFLIYRHKANIVRLIHHEENEIHLFKNKKKDA